jgi:hypothetical protein
LSIKLRISHDNNVVPPQAKKILSQWIFYKELFTQGLRAVKEENKWCKVLAITQDSLYNQTNTKLII